MNLFRRNISFKTMEKYLYPWATFLDRPCQHRALREAVALLFDSSLAPFSLSVFDPESVWLGASDLLVCSTARENEDSWGRWVGNVRISRILFTLHYKQKVSSIALVTSNWNFEPNRAPSLLGAEEGIIGRASINPAPVSCIVLEGFLQGTTPTLSNRESVH